MQSTLLRKSRGPAAPALAAAFLLGAAALIAVLRAEPESAEEAAAANAKFIARIAGAADDSRLLRLQYDPADLAALAAPNPAARQTAREASPQEAAKEKEPAPAKPRRASPVQVRAATAMPAPRPREAVLAALQPRPQEPAATEPAAPAIVERRPGPLASGLHRTSTFFTEAAHRAGLAGRGAAEKAGALGRDAATGAGAIASKAADAGRGAAEKAGDVGRGALDMAGDTLKKLNPFR